MGERIRTYKAFWPFYVSQHQNRICRNLHLLGMFFLLGILALAIVFKPWLATLAPVVVYGPAWIGHFFFERNRPATFDYPFWSLISDFRMCALMCLGRMDRELNRMMVLNQET